MLFGEEYLIFLAFCGIIEEKEGIECLKEAALEYSSTAVIIGIGRLG